MWAASEITFVFAEGSQTCWRTFGIQHAQKKNTPLSPALSGDALLFFFLSLSDECESAAQTAGDAYNSNRVGEDTRLFCISVYQMKSCQVAVSLLCVHKKGMMAVGSGAFSFFFMTARVRLF